MKFRPLPVLALGLLLGGCQPAPAPQAAAPQATADAGTPETPVAEATPVVQQTADIPTLQVDTVNGGRYDLAEYRGTRTLAVSELLAIGRAVAEILAAVHERGVLHRDIKPSNILTDPANDYVAQFVQDVDRARVLTAGSVMAPPAAATPLSAGVRGALRVMRDLQVGSVAVLEGRRYLGSVSDRAVVRAVKAGSTDLRSLISNAQPVVSPNDPLTEVVERAVESPIPIAVVDDQRRLLGTIPRVTLLAALGNVDPQTTEIPIIEAPSSVPQAELMSSLVAVGESVGRPATGGGA